MPYSITGTPQIESRLQKDFQVISGKIQELVGSNLAAIVLSGGYGRGEGGVATRGIEFFPVNDYDFFVIVQNISMPGFFSLRANIKRLSEQLASTLNIGIDLALIRREALQTLEPSILWYETKRGHQVLWGDNSLMEDVPEWKASDIPLWDGALLLMNRGAMLLRALAMTQSNLQPSLAEQTIIKTACWKAVLSWGDCLLLSQQHYHYRYQIRERQIGTMQKITGFPDQENLSFWYGQALHYKLYQEDLFPLNLPIAKWVRQIVEKHEQVFRWCEECRLGKHGFDWAHYAQWFPKLPGSNSVSQCLKNMLNNVRHSGKPQGISRLKWIVADPREKLMATFPLLAFSPTPQNLEWCGQTLGCSWRKDTGGEWQALVARFHKLWH